MFKRIVKILPAVCLAAGVAWAVESPFIGEWKLDPSKSRMPDEMKIENEGGNGVGAEPIVVDGTDQPGYGETLLSVSAYRQDRREGDGYRGDWALSRSEGLDDHGARSWPRQAECDGIRAEVESRWLAS
jgi:hypothetical protein